MMPRPCHCGYFDPELRRNPQNNGVGYQCKSCNDVLSEWISHGDLPPGTNVLSLPLWDRTIKHPGQGSLL